MRHLRRDKRVQLTSTFHLTMEYTMTKTKPVYRDSKTGQFTDKINVTRRPATTETERRPVGKPTKKK